MNIDLEKTVLVAAALALSACGSSGPSAVAGQVVEVGQNAGGVTVSHDSVADTLTITDGVNTYVYDGVNYAEREAIVSFERDSFEWFDFASRGETSSGGGRVYLVNSTVDGYEAAFTIVERVGDTTVPNSGTASFAGDYVAFYYEIEDEDPVYFENPTGTVLMTADFGAATISGSITDRETYGTPMDDVIFDPATISGGSFSGTTSGGGNPQYIASAGTYSGLFTGSGADEVVGAVSIPLFDDVEGQNGFELGVFVAEEVVP